MIANIINYDKHLSGFMFLYTSDNSVSRYKYQDSQSDPHSAVKQTFLNFHD